MGRETHRRWQVALDRDAIMAIGEAFHDRLASGDTDSWIELFAEDCQFRTSFTPEPILGRSSLRALVDSWPKVLNQPEWHVVEGNRLVLGWNERLPSMSESAPSYRGISTLLFDDAGLILEYDGVFDTAAVVAALKA